MEGNTYGVEGIIVQNRGLNQMPVQAVFSTYSGESDSTWGSNAWSIQANTNFFTGSNGQTDWVQFTEQNNLYTLK
jgi:hypothetical protein